MRLKEIVRGSKTDINIGKKWRFGSVPRAEFPMAKKAYGLGSSFKWNVITFQALGSECRVLIVVNERKQKYEAVLGVMADDELRILCSYEYHATEPGWHCHATHDDSETLRGPWIKRVPRSHNPHRAEKFPTFNMGDETAAIRFAIDRYNIEPEGTLL